MFAVLAAMCTTDEALESLTEFRSMMLDALTPVILGMTGGERQYMKTSMGTVREQKRWYDGLVKRKVSGVKA